MKSFRFRRAALTVTQLEDRSVPAVYGVSTYPGSTVVAENANDAMAAHGVLLPTLPGEIITGVTASVWGNMADARDFRAGIDVDLDGMSDITVQGSRIGTTNRVAFDLGTGVRLNLPARYTLTLDTPDQFTGSRLSVRLTDIQTRRPGQNLVFGPAHTLVLQSSPKADLAVTLSAPAQVNAGSNVTVRMTAVNNGPKSASGAVLQLAIPTGLTVVNSGGGIVGNGAIEWRMPSMGNRQVISKTVVFGTSPAQSGPVDFAATIHAVTRDPNSGNNRATVTTNVVQPQPPVGSLYVTQSHVPLRGQQLLGGTTGNAVLRLTLRAMDGDVDVTKLRFTSVAGLASSVDRLDLYKPGDVLPFASATVAGTGSDTVTSVLDGVPVQNFTARLNSGQLVILRDTQVDVLVRPVMKTDTDGGRPENITFTLLGTPVANPATEEGAVHAHSNGYTLVANDGDMYAEGEIFVGVAAPAPNTSRLTGPTSVWVGSRLTTAINANADADNTNVPTGPSTIGEWRLGAAQHGNTRNGLNKFDLETVWLRVDAGNVALQDLYLYNKSDASVRVAAQAYMLDGVTPLYGSLTGSFLVKVDLRGASPLNDRIDSGASAQYVLGGNVTNTRVSSTQQSSLQATLLLNRLEWNDTDAGQDNFLMGVDLNDTEIRSTRYVS